MEENKTYLITIKYIEEFEGKEKELYMCKSYNYNVNGIITLIMNDTYEAEIGAQRVDIVLNQIRAIYINEIEDKSK